MAGAGPSTGFHPHLPGLGHRFLSKALGAGMWFFIMYRMRQDGAVMLGLRHPWDGHGHGGHAIEGDHGDHGHH